MTDRDVIDMLAGLAPDSPLALIRDRKPRTRENAQASYRALFEPAVAGDVTMQERFAVASFVAGLHGQDEVAAFYAAGLSRTAPTQSFVEAIAAEVVRGRTVGPYGTYPKGRLSVEDMDGPDYQIAEPHCISFGPKLTAALTHVHMLVFHPRDATAEALQKLLDAGWSNTGIVILSQEVAFLAFQIRVVAGLRTLAAARA
jgi:CMD domain protein